MKALLRQLLDAEMFNVNGNHNIVLVPDIEEAGEAGSFSIPNDLFPANCRVCRLSGGQAFLQSLARELPTDQPVRVFLFPPLLSRRDISDTLRAQFPLMDLGEIVVTRVTEIVGPGSRIGALLPGSFFFNEHSRGTRERLTQVAVLRLVIKHDHPAGVFGLEVHPSFRMGAVFLEKGGVMWIARMGADTQTTAHNGPVRPWPRSTVLHASRGIPCLCPRRGRRCCRNRC